MDERLYIDGRGIAWAVVQCDQCNEVHKYSGPKALSGPVVCEHCHRSLDVGPELLSALMKRLNPLERSEVAQGTSPRA